MAKRQLKKNNGSITFESIKSGDCERFGEALRAAGVAFEIEDRGDDARKLRIGPDADFIAIYELHKFAFDE